MRGLNLLAALYAIVPPAIRDIGFSLPTQRPTRDQVESERRLAAANAKRERRANKLKLIDWTKVPRGTMTNKGEILNVRRNLASVLLYDDEGRPTIDHLMPIKWMRIVPATRWTYHDGGECPVPDGVKFDVTTRSDVFITSARTIMPSVKFWKHESRAIDIIAYRITSVDRAGGFTDCPDEVTE